MREGAISLLILLSIVATGAAAQEQGDDEEAMDTAVAEQVESTPPQLDRETFLPSEEVEADTAVAFPTDI